MSSKEVGIEEARKRLGEMVTGVQQGPDIIITRNGKPAARLTRMEDTVTAPATSQAQQAGEIIKLTLSEVQQMMDMSSRTVDTASSLARQGSITEATYHAAAVRAAETRVWADLAGRLDLTADDVANPPTDLTADEAEHIIATARFHVGVLRHQTEQPPTIDVHDHVALGAAVLTLTRRAAALRLIAVVESILAG